MLDAPGKALIEVSGLKMYFPITAGVFRKHVGDVKAVDNVSFTIYEGETLGLVGESGCGKSTCGRAILRLYEPTAGAVRIDSKDVLAADANTLREMRLSGHSFSEIAERLPLRSKSACIGKYNRLVIIACEKRQRAPETSPRSSRHRRPRPAHRDAL